MTDAVETTRPPASPSAGSGSSWRRPTTIWGEVRLWLVDLEDPACHRFESALSAAEAEQAGRFVFADDGRRYRAAHAVLRELLQAHGVLAAGDAFRVGAHGKPRAPDPRCPAFNLSHSGARALIGIGGAAELGVDIERLHRLPDMRELAEQHFSESEQEVLRRLPVDVAERAFLTVWTRKEACLKAIGSGLTTAPHTFHVDVVAAARDVVVPVPGGTASVRVESLDLGPDLVAAVATTTNVSNGASR